MESYESEDMKEGVMEESMKKNDKDTKESMKNVDGANGGGDGVKKEPVKAAIESNISQWN